MRFEKSGKSYDIIVHLDEVEKTWFRDRVISGGFSLPPNSSFALYCGDASNKSWNIFTSRWEKPSEAFVATQWRWKGIVMLVCFFILVFALLIIWLRKIRKKKNSF